MSVGIDSDELVYNWWEEHNDELQRTLFFVVFWLDMNLRSKTFRLAFFAVLAALLVWGIFLDPRALLAGLVTGVVIGLLIFFLR